MEYGEWEIENEASLQRKRCGGHWEGISGVEESEHDGEESAQQTGPTRVIEE